MLDIPQYVEHEPVVQNQVVINRSNNWDLSKKIYVTPAVPVTTPVPEKTYKVTDSSLAVTFVEGEDPDLVLSNLALDKHKSYVVNSYGHTNKEAQASAIKAGTWLKQKGYRVKEVRYFVGDRKIEVKEGFDSVIYDRVK